MSAVLRPLSDRPLNDNYTPPEPWRCLTSVEHECSGLVVGFVGAYPVCAAGAPAEIEERRAESLRIEALMDTPEMRREAAREQAWEARVS